ncbi:MAG: sensor histidine kinase [Anaerolineae bacterium]
MSQADTSLQGLIDDAMALLSASRQNLQTLANRLDQHLQDAPGAESNGRRTQLAALHHLREQTGLLLNHSQSLATLLEGDVEGPVRAGYPLSPVELLQHQEEERARTAKSLENTSAQLLANAIFELAAVKKLITGQENISIVIEGVNALQQELEQGLTNLRLLIADLEPNTVLGSFGLVAGLRRYLEKFQETTGLKTELQVHTLIERLPGTVEIAIFRVIQETLHNIRQHAAASRVQVSISEENGTLKFSVLDDGIGLAPNLVGHNQHRLGLVSINQIAGLLGGKLEIKSEQHKGTQVILTIPHLKF